MTNGRILVGVVGAPHGVRGEVRLKSYTEDPMALAGFPAVWVGPTAARLLRITAARRLKDDMLVVRLDGIGDRDAAQALTNAQLFVAREDFPAPDEDEFYHADLIGLAVVLPDGRAVGAVAAVANFGAGDLIEVAPETGESFYVPFTRAFVPTVDLGARRVILSNEAVAAASGDERDQAEEA